MSMRTKYASTRFSIVKRSKGQSAVDAASYISRSVLVSEYDGKTYRPKYHEDLVHCEINLPEYAPEEWLDRAVLWNSVELNEKQKNAHRRCPRRAHKTIRSVVYLCAPHNWGEPILPEILLTLPAKNCHPQNLLNWRIRRCFLLSSFHRRDRRFCLFHLPSHPHFSPSFFVFHRLPALCRSKSR